MTFRHPANGHTVTVRKSFLWCLLFGCFYFMKHDAWSSAFIALVAAIFTGGLAWLIRGAGDKNALINAGGYGMSGVEHGGEVVAHLGERQAAQAVVGAEGDDDDRRLVLAQRIGQPGAAAGRGCAGDGEVGDAIIEALFRQPLAEQRRPGLFGTDAVAGGKRIAHDQDGAGGERRGSGAEQGKQEQDDPHDGKTGG